MRFPTDNTAAVAILLAIVAWWIWWLIPPTTTGSTPDPAPLTTVTGTTINEEYLP